MRNEVNKNQGNFEVFDQVEDKLTGNSLVVSLVQQLGVPVEKIETYTNGLYAALGSENQPERIIRYLRLKLAIKDK